VVLDGAGNIYIADSVHNRIRKVTASTGIISTVAGTGSSTYTGDNGLAVNATLNAPGGVTIDGAGNLYIADTGNNVIRMITAATGVIHTVAGTGTAGSAGDTKAATLAELNQPWGVTLDISGNLYIADTSNHLIREVMASTGIITTVAGNGFINSDGTGGYSGDNGQATLAALNFPFAVAFDAQGNMYIPDSRNDRVREVTAVGGIITGSCTITTFAGTGYGGLAGDGGPATAATLWSPSGLAVDPAGNIYIADTQNDRIRKVSSATQYITSIAGNGAGEFAATTHLLPRPACTGPTASLWMDTGICSSQTISTSASGRSRVIWPF
jgi:sugar lactone lactonase YvrE